MRWTVRGDNVTDPRARFHWADATAFRPEGAVDAVVCNPPFHAGAQPPIPALGAAFIARGRRCCTPAAQLWLVANRHLPYDAVLTDTFRDVEGDRWRRRLSCDPCRAARPRRTALT